MEKIIKIEETEFSYDCEDCADYEGYQIVTDKQLIKMGIYNQPACCEEWGFFMSEDILTDFVGAELKDIRIVDKSLNNKRLDEIENLDEGGVMFVNFETSKGTLQFVAYNHHNGYYGHDAVVISKQLNHECCL